MARSSGETFRESSEQVDFRDADDFASSDMAMPDPEPGVSYFHYLEMVEECLVDRMAGYLDGKADDIDSAVVGVERDTVMSTMARDLTSQFLGDNFRSGDDGSLTDRERSGNDWISAALEDRLASLTLDMMVCERAGDLRYTENVGADFVEQVASFRAVDGGIARCVRGGDDLQNFRDILDLHDLVNVVEGRPVDGLDNSWVMKALDELRTDLIALGGDALHDFNVSPEDDVLAARHLYMMSLENAMVREQMVAVSRQDNGAASYVSEMGVDYVVDGVLTDEGRDRLQRILDAFETMPAFDEEQLRAAREITVSLTGYDLGDYYLDD